MEVSCKGFLKPVTVTLRDPLKCCLRVSFPGSLRDSGLRVKRVPGVSKTLKFRYILVYT